MTGSTYVQKILKSVQKITDDSHKEMISKITVELELSEEQQTKLQEIVNTLFASQEGGKQIVKKKRSPTQYNMFMKENIMKLKKENPDMEKTELMRKSAELWQIEKKKKAK